MPLIASNLAASRAKLRKPPAWEQSILGVIDGGGQIAGELAGFASKAAQDTLNRTQQTQAPQDTSFWDYLTMDQEQLNQRALANTRQHALAYKPYAEQILQDVQKGRQQLQPDLGNIGRTTSMASAALPDLMLSGPGLPLKVANTTQNAVRALGGENPVGGAAGLAFKGNGLASNTGAQGVQELLNYIKNLFQ